MLAKTHQAFGLFTVALALHYTHTPIVSVPGVAALGVSLITSILSDADNPNSTPAKAFFPVAWLLELLQVKHRGATHSILAAALWWALAAVVRHWVISIGTLHVAAWPIAIGAAVGYTSHIVIDLLNREGEQLFWPLRGRFALYLVSSDGLVNRLLEPVFLVAFFAVVLFGIGAEYATVRFIFVTAHHLSNLIPIP